MTAISITGYMFLALLQLHPLLSARDAASFPPLPEDPRLAHVATEDILFYASWAGRAEPDPNSKNHTERLLADPAVTNLFSSLIGTVSEKIDEEIAKEKPEGRTQAKKMARTLALVGKTLMTRPVVGFLSEITATTSGVNFEAALVVDVGTARNEIVNALPFMLNETAPDRNQMPGAFDLKPKAIGGPAYIIRENTIPLPPPDKATDKPDENDLKRKTPKELEYDPDREFNLIKIDGHWFYEWRHPGTPLITLGFVDNYLVLIAGKATRDHVLAALSGKGTTPRWYTEARERMPVKRLARLSYLNTGQIIKLSRLALLFGATEYAGIVDETLSLLGVANMSSIASVTGLDETQIRSHVSIQFDGETTGLMAALPNKPLTLDQLKSIPANATVVVAGHVDLAKIENLVQEAESVVKELGLDSNGMITETKNWLASKQAEWKAERGVDFSLEILAPYGEHWIFYAVEGDISIQSMLLADPAGLRRFEAKVIAAGQARGEPFIEFQAGKFKAWHREGIKRCWCITDHAIIVADSPEDLRAHLKQLADGSSITSNPKVKQLFTDDSAPVLLVYVDDVAVFRKCYADLQRYAPLFQKAFTSMDLDSSSIQLPSSAEIEKHLTSSTHVWRRTKDGLAIETHGTLPVDFLHYLEFKAMVDMVAPMMGISIDKN